MFSSVRLLLCGISLALGCAWSVSCFGEEGSTTINLASPPESLDTSPLPIKVVEAYPNLRIERPVAITGAGDGSGRLFIASQMGDIYSIDQKDEQVEEATPYLDLRSVVRYVDKENEEGLLGLAFHPDHKTNGELFVYYTTSRRPHVSIISRFTAKPGQPGPVDLQSEEILMTIQQPFWNHNGGTLAFGPDGYLYVALGDGGKGNDPLGSGQDLSKLLGSVLRIDVDTEAEGRPYGIPADNPFVDRGHAWPEIYAYGIRNIWRMAFDPKTGDLWAADVGQNLWEEVNLIVKGGNYGWSLREGGHRFDANGKGVAPRADLIEPLIEYPHTENWGKSITGGAVYRGSRVPELDGYYLYGDYISGLLWGLKYDRETKKVVANRPIDWDRLQIFTFGQTDDGEVLMSTMMGGGRIYRFSAK
ncbi:Quinoprotein glucose dehydrogenase B precursor [Roseimaritima multifibrata]|uniref:Quinoprotein glucose dehydrogenase B n=1 Tax=Roseimaritima multifibrata TaxID=1930274 RepID=A0A517MIZ9_9BACT|nr:PQQ-dependent sugar dehydrogenase [Roseimaritima multifibrata]QDS94866.1 Quinoprotein glucose dehydrogenase B precursor [Roseimaritima multifibrata]